MPAHTQRIASKLMAEEDAMSSHKPSTDSVSLMQTFASLGSSAFLVWCEKWLLVKLKRVHCHVGRAKPELPVLTRSEGCDVLVMSNESFALLLLHTGS